MLFHFDKIMKFLDKDFSSITVMLFGDYSDMKREIGSEKGSKKKMGSVRKENWFGTSMIVPIQSSISSQFIFSIFSKFGSVQIKNFPRVLRHFDGIVFALFLLYTFSISSIQAAKSMPKSMKAHSMPSFLYSSCSSTNIWWLKNCCNFSLVKLMHSCSKPLNCSRKAKANKNGNICFLEQREAFLCLMMVSCF